MNPPEIARVERVTGFGMVSEADAYIYHPHDLDALRAVLRLAKEQERRVTMRGTGLSYGDAAIYPEACVIELDRMANILQWDDESGVVDCQAGVTLEQLWRHCLEDGWWPPVVSGTMFPTLGGALSMNIHGKNAFKVGPIGNHVLELDLMNADGEVRTIRREDPDFRIVVGGAGQFGAIVRAKLQMKRIHSGDLRVLAVSCRNWTEQFEVLERYRETADYMVSWVDCFAGGSSSGRGLYHAAWYEDEGPGLHNSLKLSNQDLPDTVMGLVPKSVVWRFLKVLNTRLGMRFVNWARYRSGTALGNGKVHGQSLVAFSFLLDYVPNWRNAYLPGGFIQYQSFIPKEHAAEVFARQIELQKKARLESFLGVLKRHVPDEYLLTHSVDGYSLALDFKVTRRNRARLFDLCHRMNDIVLQAGGRFYFAKDQTLRPDDVAGYLGEETLAELRAKKLELDPDGLFTSQLAERLHLFGPEPAVR